jgi:hypothetical protein
MDGSARCGVNALTREDRREGDHTGHRSEEAERRRMERSPPRSPG